FFRAEDGIRAFHVTGVQTCALPISATTRALLNEVDKGLIPQELILACRVREIWAGSRHFWMAFDRRHHQAEERYWNCSWVIAVQIGRASCRERVSIKEAVVAAKRTV